MTQIQDAELSPEIVLGEMTKNGVTHVVWLPDSETNFLYQLMLDNECYATTGAQPVPNAKNVAYDVIARGCGYPRAFAFDELADFQANITSILGQPGPVFVALKVVPEVENVPIGQRQRWQTRTRDRVLADLRAELGIAR